MRRGVMGEVVSVRLNDGREFVGRVVGVTPGRGGSVALDVHGVETVIGWCYVESLWRSAA